MLLPVVVAEAASYDIAAYVWPAYHPAERWAELGIFKDGKGEWQNVYEAVKRTPDDYQGVKPLWGYENEADPVVVARKIDAATAAGVNVFIYDWYWYGGRPFLEEALNNGFLKASNCERMKFYLMYANHDVTKLWDNKVARPEKNKVVWPARISDADWKTIVARWISQYFTKSNYYKIKERPVLSIYDVSAFVKWDGVKRAKERIAYLRQEVKKAGFPDVHLQGVDRCKPCELAVDSVTLYNWGMRTGDKYLWNETGWEGSYAEWGVDAVKAFDEMKRDANSVGAVYFPNLTCGWDTNSRYPTSQRRPIIHGSNPKDFERFARMVKAWADKNIPDDMPRLITVNAWNEWTEGAYLEPDDRFGYGYLNALWHVFSKERNRQDEHESVCRDAVFLGGRASGRR